MSINLIDYIKVCIICEGSEEYDYFSKLINFNVFSNKYKITLINAKGISNISGFYQNYYSKNQYHVVLIFCDTDKKPYTEYVKMNKKIDGFHGKSVSNSLIFYGNPCTMQIFLLHFTMIKVPSNSKKVNSKLIKEIAGVADYDGSDKKRRELFGKMYLRTYDELKKNLNVISSVDYNTINSTNFIVLLDYLENDNCDWIDNINNNL